LPTREQFFKKSKGCGLSDAQIYLLYRLLGKTAILYEHQCHGSAAERGKIEGKISGLLRDVEKSPCKYLTEFVVQLNQDDLNIIRQARMKNYSPYALSRAILDHHAEIYRDFLDWKEAEQEYVARVISRLEKRRKKALGSKTWKYGLLAGVTAVGLGAGIYLYSQHKKDDQKEEK
jgi:hypothetical protein